MVGRHSIMEDQRLTADGAPARRQTTDAGGSSRDGRVSVLADSTAARHGRGHQSRGLEHAGVGHRHGRMSKPLHRRRSSRGQRRGRDRGDGRRGLVGKRHELVHLGALLGAVSSAEIHDVLLAEKAPIRVHFEV